MDTAEGGEKMSHEAAERPIRIAGLDEQETWEPTEDDLKRPVDPKRVEELEAAERENARSEEKE